MDRVEINLQKCNLICYSHEAYDFFCKQDATHFIVTYGLEDGNSNTMFGIIETAIDDMGNGVCMLNGEFLYQYGDMCVITSFAPIKINKIEHNE